MADSVLFGTEDGELEGRVRYLVGRAGGQRVAFRVDAVREIIPSRGLTRLPGSEAWVQGLLNVRGTVLTVVDLSVRFGQSAGGANIVVVEAEGRALGVRVEEVSAVADVADGELLTVDDRQSADGLASGMVRLADDLVLVMDAGALVRTALVLA